MSHEIASQGLAMSHRDWVAKPALALGEEYPVDKLIYSDHSTRWNKVRNMHEFSILQTAAISVSGTDSGHQRLEIWFFGHTFGPLAGPIKRLTDRQRALISLACQPIRHRQID
jgi:hypothetical protein